MKYLLDTNLCIYLIKRRPSAVLTHLKRQLPAHVAISAITVAEMRYGADKSQWGAKNHQALGTFFSAFRVIDFDIQAAQVYGKLRAALERAGRPLGSLDLLIASQALTLNLILVTNNTKEFSQVPQLRIENWAIE